MNNLKKYQKIVEIKSISYISKERLKSIPFDMGNAKEYEEFLRESALEYDTLGITRTFLMFHKLTEELI